MKVKWNDSYSNPPEDRQHILFIDGDGHEVIGQYIKGRFCIRLSSVYLYYHPKYWMDLELARMCGRGEKE